MPPLVLAPGDGAPFRALHRRESGVELPWVRTRSGDPFATYEAPILAGPGRYLWVTLELSGNIRQSPRVRALRAEYPAHDTLRRLPRVYARDETAADFLLRYLAPMRGFLGELESKARTRDALLDPAGTPVEALPWLAGFVGLALDERWSIAVRRQLIAEAASLFRSRGTIPGLERFLEIALDCKPLLIEDYRLRGLGGALLGEPDVLQSSAIVGVGLRVGGALGEAAQSPLAGQADDSFRTHAHRFSVIFPCALTGEQLELARHILELHRPAHTLYRMCSAAAGLRVGQGLHVELTSVVGPSGGFATLQLDASQLGRAAILGRPLAGMRLGANELGRDSQVG